MCVSVSVCVRKREEGDRGTKKGLESNGERIREAALIEEGSRGNKTE